MRENDPLDLDSLQRGLRRIPPRQTGGGSGETELPDLWESDVVPGSALEGSISSVLAWQGLADTTTLAQLQRRGYTPPHPDELTESTLPAELDLLIRKLAELCIYLTKTNHLGDRELYELLWHDTLQEPVKDLPPEAGYFHHIDLLSDCTEENIAFYYRYYATEEERRRWQQHFPEYAMPPHCDPPYDRDRTLPRHGGR